ncbi:MAG TPA: alpha/beta hydrolase [Candidatus Saccharimonas sp.]|nr:alpha/beta hydrolase [Candidatus Saccharimonas sp.]
MNASKPIPKRHLAWRIIGYGAAGLVALAVAGVGLVYLYPLNSASLRTHHDTVLSYDESVSKVEGLVAADESAGARDECRTRFYNHGKKTGRAIVMFHGVGECPQQFEAMGQYFYAQGYNVLIPRAPHFGLADNRLHGQATAQELVAYADQSVTTASGLGDELQVIGLSGGGVLATWTAEYRTDVVSRVEVLSPFYEPSVSLVPIWQRRILDVLYGYGILPDGFSDTGLSYHALGQYGRIVANFKANPTNSGLKSVATVISHGDGAIDHDLAQSIPSHLAAVNHLSVRLYMPPAEWGLGHDIAKAEPNHDINGHSQDLYPRYFDLLQ